jgi:DNA mismatch repair protein MutL
MWKNMKIQLLLPEVASQIAAGEVIERPASVIKELVENSLDAGASHIKITVKDAGRKLIEVMDDGSGIAGDEIRLATARHATSKLRDAEDLNHIRTLGFRGEALASIGSIARLTISSRVASQDVGWKWQIESSTEKDLERIGMPTGTIVRVEDLFFNVPARLKFLKHPTTEKRYIDSLVARYALAYPRVRFHLSQDDKYVLKTTGSGTRREVLSDLFGIDVARQMLEVDFVDGDFQIQGFISPISLTRSNRRDIYFFINGRPVTDTTLTASVIKAYHSLLMVGRFPVAVLLIELPPRLIDVNVHPTKAEVRFSDSGWIFSNVQRIIRRVLISHSPVPKLEPDIGWGKWGKISATSNDSESAQQFTRIDNPIMGAPTSLPEVDEKSRNHLLPPTMPLLRLVGQIAMSYLVAEGPDGLYLIDQHAAHERVLFEKYFHQKQRGTEKQSLLQPVSVELSPTQARLLDDELSVLNLLGFEIEDFGTGSYLIRSVPALFSNIEPGIILKSVVEDFEEDEAPFSNQFEQKLIARICKRAAVKAGQTLSLVEQQALLTDLEACLSPRTCPHGRPTMIHLSIDLLNRQFGRKGAR